MRKNIDRVWSCFDSICCQVDTCTAESNSVMATEFILIPKHKYEQMEKDAVPKDGTLSSTPLLPWPSDDTPHTTDNNDNQPDLSHDDQLGPDDEIISNTDDDNDDYEVSDVLESFNVVELTYVQPIITLMENNTDVLTWKRKTGEIIFLQNLVQDSNIIEMLKDTLTATLHHVGKMEFYRGLDMLKVNLSCMKHLKNKHLPTILKGDWKIVNKKSRGKKLKSTKHRNVWIS